jgi:uncharacterized protein involved in exopolysaccharide biosynthesis
MNLRFALRLLALMISIGLCLNGLLLLLSPTQYEAVLKMKIEPDVVSDTSYNPYFMETELKVIQSENVLSNVVQALNLDSEWGKRYAGGGKLETSEAIKLLRQQLDLDTEAGTTMIIIQVWDKDPDEAARIANAVAAAYVKYRLNQHQMRAAVGIAVLERQYQDEESAIKLMQSNVDQLREKLHVQDTNDNSASIQYSNNMQGNGQEEYWDAKQELQDKRQLHQLLATRIEMIKADAMIPSHTLGSIVSPAVAPQTPAAPNRLLGAASLIYGFGIWFLARKIPR